MGLAGGARPPIPNTMETKHSMRVSPSPLHELATFEPNLPCNECHIMSFKTTPKLVISREKIKDVYRGFLLFLAHFEALSA